MRVTKTRGEKNREKAKQLKAIMTGVEQSYQGAMSTIQLMDALNFYNSFGRKDLMKYVHDYMKKFGYSKDQIEYLKNCPDWKMSQTTAKLAAIILKNGVDVLEAKHKKFLDDQIAACIEIGKLNKPEQAEEETVKRPSPQDLLREKACRIMGEIDGQIDEQMMQRDYKFDAYTFLKEQGANPQIAKIIVETYEKPLQEHIDAMNKVDPQLVEGYSHLSKVDMKKTIAFYTSIVDDAKRFMTNEKRVRKPRKPKVKSADQLVKSIKYCKSFLDLKLVSINPTEIIGAQTLWVYNTKYRKIGCYIALNSEGFSVKGTSITNFTEMSVCKTLRKPETQLNEFMNAGKVTLRKFLENINGKDSPLNGRINIDVVLLKAFK